MQVQNHNGVGVLQTQCGFVLWDLLNMCQPLPYRAFMQQIILFMPLVTIRKAQNCYRKVLTCTSVPFIERTNLMPSPRTPPGEKWSGERSRMRLRENFLR